MTVREYLEQRGYTGNVTFIKARARKDAHTPWYHAEYQTTPIYQVWEWEKAAIMDYLVLNDKQCPIDWLSGAPWKIQFDKGGLLSMLVVSKEDLETLYHPTQAASLIEFIDKELQKTLRNEK